MSDNAASRLFLFGDESGCLVFKDNGSASRYFVLATACFCGTHAALDMLSLRRELLWLRSVGEVRKDTRIDSHFHATRDEISIRHAVYRMISSIDFRIDATILEKRKGMPRITGDSVEFYKYAWFYHLKYLAPRLIANQATQVHILPSAIGANRKKAAFLNSVNNVVQQVLPRSQWSVTFDQPSADPGLQIADYCAYAIFQKWERQDETWYKYIADKVSSEFDLWRKGDAYHY